MATNNFQNPVSSTAQRVVRIEDNGVVCTLDGQETLKILRDSDPITLADAVYTLHFTDGTTMDLDIGSLLPTTQDILTLLAGSISRTELNASINALLDLADSAAQQDSFGDIAAFVLQGGSLLPGQTLEIRQSGADVVFQNHFIDRVEEIFGDTAVLTFGFSDRADATGGALRNTNRITLVAPEITGLVNTPSAYGTQGQALVVNASGDAVVWADVSAQIGAINDLPDTGTNNEVVFVNGLGDDQEGVYIWAINVWKSIANNNAVAFLLDNGLFSDGGTAVEFTDPRVSVALNSNGRVVVDTSGITSGTAAQFENQQALENFITSKADFRADIGAGVNVTHEGTAADIITNVVGGTFDSGTLTLPTGGTTDLTAFNSNPLFFAVGVAHPIHSVVTWENSSGSSFRGNVDNIIRGSEFENISTTGTETNSLFPSILIEEVPLATYNDWITADADTFPGFLLLQELVSSGRNIVVEIQTSSTVNGSTDQFRDVTCDVIELIVPQTGSSGNISDYTITHNGVAEIATTDTPEWNVIEITDARRTLTHIVQHSDETLEVTTDMVINRKLNVSSIGASLDSGADQFAVLTDRGEFTTTVIPVDNTNSLVFSGTDNTTLGEIFNGLTEVQGQLFCTLIDTSITADSTITETGVGFIYRVTDSGIGGVTIERSTQTDGSGFTEATGGQLQFTFFTGIQSSANTILITDNVVFQGTIAGLGIPNIPTPDPGTSPTAQDSDDVGKFLLVNTRGVYFLPDVTFADSVRNLIEEEATTGNVGITSGTYAVSAAGIVTLPKAVGDDVIITGLNQGGGGGAAASSGGWEGSNTTASEFPAGNISATSLALSETFTLGSIGTVSTNGVSLVAGSYVVRVSATALNASKSGTSRTYVSAGLQIGSEDAIFGGYTGYLRNRFDNDGGEAIYEELVTLDATTVVTPMFRTLAESQTEDSGYQIPVGGLKIIVIPLSGAAAGGADTDALATGDIGYWDDSDGSFQPSGLTFTETQTPITGTLDQPSHAHTNERGVVIEHVLIGSEVANATAVDFGDGVIHPIVQVEEDVANTRYIIHYIVSQDTVITNGATATFYFYDYNTQGRFIGLTVGYQNSICSITQGGFRMRRPTTEVFLGNGNLVLQDANGTLVLRGGDTLFLANGFTLPTGEDITNLAVNASGIMVEGTGGGGGFTTEQIQDIVGGMFIGNTETGIIATYRDEDGTIDLQTSGEIRQITTSGPITGGAVSGTANIGFAGLTGEVTATTAGVTTIGADAVDGSNIADDSIDISHLSASGTPSDSTYLRGDNTWQSITPGGTYDPSTASIGEFSDVDLTTTPTSGQVLAWNATDGEFQPANQTGGGISEEQRFKEGGYLTAISQGTVSAGSIAIFNSIPVRTLAYTSIPGFTGTWYAHTGIRIASGTIVRDDNATIWSLSPASASTSELLADTSTFNGPVGLSTEEEINDRIKSDFTETSYNSPIRRVPDYTAAETNGPSGYTLNSTDFVAFVFDGSGEGTVNDELRFTITDTAATLGISTADFISVEIAGIQIEGLEINSVASSAVLTGNTVEASLPQEIIELLMPLGTEDSSRFSSTVSYFTTDQFFWWHSRTIPRTNDIQFDGEIIQNGSVINLSVDTAFDPTSTNAQAGTAVQDALIQEVVFRTNPSSTTPPIRLQHEITLAGNTTVDSGEDYTAPATIATDAEIKVAIMLKVESFDSQAGTIHVDLTHESNTDIQSVASFTVADLARAGVLTINAVIAGSNLVAGATYDVVYRGVGNVSSVTFISSVDFDFDSGGLFVKPEGYEFIDQRIESYGNGTRQELHTNYLTGAEIGEHFLAGTLTHNDGTLVLSDGFNPDDTNFRSGADAYISDGGDRVQVSFAFANGSSREQDFHVGRLLLIQFNDGESTPTNSIIYRARVYFNNVGFPGDPVEIYANLIDSNNNLINPLSAVSDTDTTTVLAALTALANSSASGNELFNASQVSISLDLSSSQPEFTASVGLNVNSLNGFQSQGGLFPSKATLFLGFQSDGTEINVPGIGDRTPTIYTTSGVAWYYWNTLFLTGDVLSEPENNAGLWTNGANPETATIRFNLRG